MMFNFAVKRQSFGIGSFIFMMVFGLIFSAGGIFFYQSTRISESWERIQGSVIDVRTREGDDSTLYSPVVKYEINGNEYSVTSSVSSSAYPSLGAVREVAYNPTNPADAKVVEGKFFDFMMLMFPAIGILVMVLSVVGLINSIKRNNEIERLKVQGRKVEGVLTDIQSYGEKSSTYKIVVSAPDSTGGVKNYTSDILYGIGGLMMADYRSNPIPIDVYIDPMNSNSYYVDISDIPNLTPERINQLIMNARSTMTGNTPTTTQTTSEF